MKIFVNKKNRQTKRKMFLTMIILSFALFGCDPPRYYNLFIINDCNDDIEVKITDDRGKKSNFKIEPKGKQMVHEDMVPQPLNIGVVHAFFKEIIVTKENDTSKINYIDKDLWHLEQVSKFQANCCLTVNPEDFE